MGFPSGDLDLVYRWVDAAPGRFVPAPQWNGVTIAPDVEFLRGEYSAGRLEAMGEITSQYAGLSPADLAIQPYFALAEELDLPVLIHT